MVCYHFKLTAIIVHLFHCECPQFALFFFFIISKLNGILQVCRAILLCCAKHGPLNAIRVISFSFYTMHHTF